jgi:WD40 repeat protein
VQVATFQPTDIAFNVAFSRDSRYLLMDIKDRSVVVCEIIKSFRAQDAQAEAASGSCSPLDGAAGKQPCSSVKLTFRHRLYPPTFALDPEGFRFKPTFGGKNNAFVAMGSVQGEVRLWHWESEKYLCGLEGHSQPVNSVAWHPMDQHMLVSASDDATLRVWTSPASDGDNAQPGHGP